MKVLLDTTALIDLMRKDKNNENLVKKLEELRSKGCSFCTTVINVYEVRRGIMLMKDNLEKQLNAFRLIEMNLYVLTLDYSATEKASEIYANLRKKGKEIDEGDYLIAGVCLSNEIKTILTRNEKHFCEIGSLKVINYSGNSVNDR